MTPFARHTLDLALEEYDSEEEALLATAQAILETGWGESAPGNNLFGIKGEGTQRTTHEEVDGKLVKTTANFRDYTDRRESIRDRETFLRINPRYRNAGYFSASTAEEKADALQRAGYATDSNYAAKLKNIIETLRRDTSTDNSDTETYAYPSGERYRESSNESDPTPNMTTPLSTPTQWRLPPQEGESRDPFSALAGDPFLQMGLGILGARTGSGIRNIASGIQSGLSAVQRFRAYQQLQELQRQKAQAGPANTTRMRDFAFLLQQGVPRSEAIERVFGTGRQGPLVQIGQGGSQYGSIPSGYERIVDPETGAVRDRPITGSKEWTSRSDEIRATEQALSKVERMKSLVSEHGAEGLPLVSDQKVRGEMEQLYGSMVADIAQLRGMGVLQPGELENIESRLNDPTSVGQYFRANDRTLAQYDALADQYRQKLERLRGTDSSGSTRTTTSDNDPLGIR